MFRVFVLFCCVAVALAAEWNCVATSGVFDLSTDCTMTDEVAVSGDLTVTGNATVYSTLTAASSKRHFKIISGAHTLRLKWLNLTGGSPSGDHGGSIFIKDYACHLNISHCVFYNNTAGFEKEGGAIYVSDSITKDA